MNKDGKPMTTITREQQKQILIDTANHVISRDNTSPYSENLRELARIALAALEAEKGAEPVAFINGAWTLVYYRPPKELGLKIGDKLYTAQPVPVVPEKMSKHALFEVAIARFSKMNEGFPIKRFKADWVISWMLENFPPVAQKQGDN
ncbi:TPA: hypothetical protein N3D02_003866 [Salmonella enterica subsp. enterica serovar Essen]|nr:hypothetical protein [Salmonella enterica]EBS4172573.1 hypothetical protein [Salmonella enterica subsp. enterica serovar Elisabethville]EDS6984876.1 hypothetical protein [Salmonella enterica subsp. enterica serovar Telelkebir]EIN0702173.1 hypothetical protein [Salmonella enterica subsp. enterica serovar Durham]MJS61923.1 hypothetical protein [Salmonella enterica subsp. enterica]HCM2345556.1 hypothetical protein [Salmonella enterica subsp. enterica serovar Essen]